MKKIVLYTTGCPKCIVLAEKLDAANISYGKETDVKQMRSMKIVSAPVLEIDGFRMDFHEAIEWLNGGCL